MERTSKYDGSTASALDHYFGNTVAAVRILLLGHKEGQFSQVHIDYEKTKQEFVTNLNLALEQQVPEYGNVRRQDLRNIIQLAEAGSWSNVETIKDLYKAYYKIRGREFDEMELFPSEGRTTIRIGDGTVTTSKYDGSTAKALGYFFGNKVAIARIWLLDDKDDRLPDKNYEKLKQEFITGLNQALESQTLEYANVKREDLIEMVRLAESGSFSDVETIRGLYRAYFNITGEEFNETKLFYESRSFPTRKELFPRENFVMRLLRHVQSYLE